MTNSRLVRRFVFQAMLLSLVVGTCLMTLSVRADESSVGGVTEDEYEVTESETEVDDAESEDENSDAENDGNEERNVDTAKTYGQSVETPYNEYYHQQPMYHQSQPQYYQQQPQQYQPQPQYYNPAPAYAPQPTHYSKPKKAKKEKKKVYVPVFVPEKEKKKMKIISVDKGFYILGGTQLFGKYKSLKHCMKACAVTPSCLGGDFNPWLHKCYQHTNYTACNTLRAHPQYVHFSKVPCSVVDAPSGRVTLGASMANGIEQKGIESLQQCIKKCAIAGGGVQPTATVPESFNRQACFAIDYDFSTHKCFFFGSNVLVSLSPLPIVFYLHCPVQANVLPSSLGSRPNPNVVHITFCPLPTGFRG